MAELTNTRKPEQAKKRYSILKTNNKNVVSLSRGLYIGIGKSNADVVELVDTRDLIKKLSAPLETVGSRTAQIRGTLNRSG